MHILQIRKLRLLRLGNSTKVTYLESGGTFQNTKLGKCSPFVEKFSIRHQDMGFQLTLSYPEKSIPQNVPTCAYGLCLHALGYHD